MSAPLRFNITATCRSSAARTGTIETLHGQFQTPAFMPVGTRGTVKGLLPRLIEATGSEIILNNAYHLMLRPGDDLIARRGGMHRFMRWNRPILTDSGGYQAYSMADINDIDDDGVTFTSIINGSRIHLTPERSIEVQNNLGADIIMAFDDCPPSVDPAAFEEMHQRLTGQRKRPRSPQYNHQQRLREANERTARWLERCHAAHKRPDEQALFGIVQGGTDPELRTQSVEQICNMDLPGYAIGGVAVGEGPDQIRSIVAHTAPLMPVEKPRYLMGVGYERDIVTAVRAGVDMFDCVLPTRNGRNACAFTRTGRLRLRNAQFAEDDRPLDPVLSEELAETLPELGYSRAYLRHLFISREMLGPIIVSLHNIVHFQRLMVDIRRAIREDAWSQLYDNWPVLRTQQSDFAEMQDRD